MSKNPFVQMDTIEGSGEGVWEDEPREKGAKKKSKMRNPFEIGDDEGERKGKGEGRRMGDGNERLPVTYPVRKGLDTFDVCSFSFFLPFFFFFFFFFLSHYGLFSFPPLPPFPFPKEEVNVVLVGNMGVGKSTLGNYLFNMGDKSDSLFETSADPTESCRFFTPPPLAPPSPPPPPPLSSTPSPFSLFCTFCFLLFLSLFLLSSFSFSLFVSKRAQVKSFGVEFAGKRVRMNIMDTPGLSELKPAEDLKHTIG